MRQRRTLVVPVLVGLWLCLTTSPVRALSPYHGWVIGSLTIEGVPSRLAKELQSGLALNLRSGLLDSRRPRFSENDLAEDLRRIELHLARQGYPHAAVDAQLEPGDRRKMLKVVFVIWLGPEVRVGKVHITGLPPNLEERAAEVTHRLVAGTRFQDQVISQTATSLDSLLHTNGYAQTRVESVVTLPDSITADLAFHIEAGGRYRFESVSLRGVPQDLLAVTLKTIDLAPGTPYSREVVDRSRDNLRTLGLYRQIRLTWDDTGPETLELQADLQIGSPRTVSASIGSWTDDPWRLEAYWGHNNLFKRGRGFAVDGAFSRYQRLLRAKVWWLALLGPRTRLETSAKREIQDEDSYYLDQYELGVGALVDYGRNSSLSYGIKADNNDVTEKIPEQDSFKQEKGLQTIFQARLFLDRSDGLLMPTRGFRLTLGGELSPPGILSESPYAMVETEGVWYVPLAEKGVLAQRLNLATAWPLSDQQELLSHRRLYAGGVSSHRSYKRRSLGPLNADGNPTGGEVRVLGNVELRLPLLGILGGNLFLDVGQVWEKQDLFALGELKVGLGGGVAIITPIGPIRFDLGWNLTDPAPGLPRSVFHVSIGNPF